jgi:uncharacterized membrane protein (UPF0127 family)
MGLCSRVDTGGSSLRRTPCHESHYYAPRAGTLGPVESAGDVERFAGLPHRSLPGGLTLVEARTSRARRRGLARLDSLPADHALLIPRCPSIHTFGMRFPLDLIWLTKDGSVARVDRAVPPRRMRLCARARSVVETAAGASDAFLSAGVGVPGGP